MRNISLAFKVSSFLYWNMHERGHGRYLDAAGGYGILTRIMRDFGFDFYWADKYCSNIMARGFEYAHHLKGCCAVTAMEVMEHLVDPLAFVRESLEVAGADTLLFTTELFERDPPELDWLYYAFPSGQHIGFFTKLSLEVLGRRLGMHFYTANGLHILSRRMFNQTCLQWSTHPWMTKMSFFCVTRRRLKSKTMQDHRFMTGSQ
ncbi:MAG: class I SAM-dependent methyltransferase [Desulfomicrobium sp.]